MIQSNNDFMVVPSILSADFGKFVEETQDVDIPEIEYLHVDVMDGHFVPNLTFGPKVVSSLKKHTRFKLDVHLMIDNINEFIPLFSEAGADVITIHQEASLHLHRAIHQIKEFGKQAGVSINPATPIEHLKYVLEDVDLVLVMSVNPGFGGQKFIPSSLNKISELKKLREEKNYNYVIEVDGGIDPNTAPEIVLAGANFLVAGNAIFGQPNRVEAIHKILDACTAAKLKASSRLV